MKLDRRRRVEEIATRASELPEEQRERFLAEACGDDAELRSAVGGELARRRLELTKTRPAGRDNRGVELPEPGTFPGYEILRELQHGGQGVVYQAIQKSTKRKVAIKVLRDGQFASAAGRKRFEREIEAVAQLDHTDVISIFHADATADGRPFYVMDYVRGVPLDQYVREHQLPLQEMLRLFARIGHAVHHAHRRGVLHRDLKPSNILVDGDGNPKILDFGLAKWLTGPGDSALTVTQAAIGTLPYMAPEQTLSDPDKIDVRTDVYGLGVILYLLLTGRYPYPVTGDLAKVLDHIVDTPPIPPEKNWSGESGINPPAGSTSGARRCPIDREVRTIVLRALAKQRERRYQSAGDLARDIEHYLTGKPIEARSDSALYVLSMCSRAFIRRHVVASLVFAVVAVAVVTQFFFRPLIYSWTPLNRHYERFLIRTLTNRGQTAFEHVRIIAITDETDAESLAEEEGLIGVTTGKVRSLRRLHGRLMEKLAGSGIRTLAWDICFPGESEYDDDFVEGAGALLNTGVSVVVATDDWSVDESGLPRLSRKIVPHVRWGCMIAEVSTTASWRLELVVQRGESNSMPSLALAALAAARQPDAEAVFRLDSLAQSERLGEHRLEVRYRTASPLSERAAQWVGGSDRVALTTVDDLEADDPNLGLDRGDRVGLLYVRVPEQPVLDASTIAYDRVWRANERQLRDWFAGKVILVCNLSGGVDRHVDAGGRQIAGAFIHAAGIDMLLQGVPIREPQPSDAYLIVLGGALLGLLSSRIARDSRAKRYALVLVLAAVICVVFVVAYERSHYLYNPLVPVSALVLSAGAGMFVRREPAGRT